MSYTINSALEKLNNREITSVELTKHYLNRIKKYDPQIKSCLTICEDLALRQAQEADEKRARGEKGALLGIPYLAKDNILTAGVRTTAASKMLENYIAPYNATIIRKITEEGAVLLGKTNLDEWAHGASTENSAFRPTHNPWDLDRVPGGSSGGSAAAVAADLCVFALGTDTGGSIRCPASFCGVVGLKPSYGRSSRYGLIAMTSSTDVPGPITKTVEDAEIILKIIEGVDQNDLTTKKTELNNHSKLNSLKDIRIGLPKEYFENGLKPEVAKLIQDARVKMEELGAKFIEISLPHTKYAVPVYYIITPSEISSNLARFEGLRYGHQAQNTDTLEEFYSRNRAESLGKEAKRRIMIGTYALSAGYYDAYYIRAQKVRTKIVQELDRELNGLDAILTPTSPHPAFKIGQQNTDPLSMYLEDIFVSAASLAGLPAISIPCGFINNLPLGLQLIGKRFNDESILAIGKIYQDNTEWSQELIKLQNSKL